MIKRQSLFIFVGMFILSACGDNQTLFTLIPHTESGLDFENKLIPSDSLNVLNYEYFYNGSSVAIGDFNQDGLSDVFFSGNMVSNKMYLNKGNLKFEDVSDKAGIRNDGTWNSGVAVADVNNDGLLDIYVCTNVGEDTIDRANALFINQGINESGIPVFQDMAKAYGVEECGYSQNAAFLDYDLDGDLDLYVLTNYVGKHGPANYHPKVIDGSANNNDQLYRNNDDHTFTKVTIEAGIVYEGYGLGIAIADINVDGWPDIFIGNDYLTNDLVYINNQDGTFSNQAKDYLKHQSRFSMGCDIADVNNDGLVDIYTLDMLPQINYRKKTSSGGGTSYRTYITNEKLGYEYQYIRNMLHINNGNAPFSEVGQMLGLHHTEWSWSPLFADVDNDGHRDLLITNGFPKDLTDMDYIRFRSDVGSFTKPNQLLMILPELKLPNYGYKNHGDLNFTDNTKEWGLNALTYSNGAAFADLDNDGDLDYIVTNIDDKVQLYENNLYIEQAKESNAHYLRLKLAGKNNSSGLGAKVTIIYGEDLMQFHDHSTYRGYLSTVEDFVHFGLGNHVNIDKIEVIWPDGNTQVIQNVAADQVLNVNYNDASPQGGAARIFKKDIGETYFREVSSELGVPYIHEEKDQIDYHLQKTLPHKFSQAGPGIAVGDINNDGLEDFIVGGASLVHTSMLIQDANGKFSESLLFKKNEKYNEDEGLLLFDADQDNDLDLYIVSGSYEFVPGSDRNKDRLYLNNGKGEFTLSKGIIPDIKSSGSCVRGADFDGDGDLDLFVGGRVITGAYPFAPKSYILRNDGGIFTDATLEICSALSNVGMVTDALWTDFDNNGSSDLIVVGEFMPITMYKNSSGKLEKVENTGIGDYTGWWNSIVGADFDKDGDTDYMAGNLGLNNVYNITQDRPLQVYAKDFDNNGSIDPVLSSYFKTQTGEMAEYPVHSWEKLGNQSSAFRDQFKKFSEYGQTSMKQLIAPYDTTGMLVLNLKHPMTSYIENLGDGKFAIGALPRSAQFAPVNGLQVDDVDSDGNLDLILIGNDFGNEIISGRYDALNGLVLLGDGKGDFQALTSLESGFVVPGDAKALARLSGKNYDMIIATQNRDSLKIYTNVLKEKVERKIYKPFSTDSWAEFVHTNGQTEKVEFYYGAGYLSQSSRTLKIPKGVKKLIVFGYDGNSRELELESLNSAL